MALDDFYAFMPNHSYIFVPTREMWPASSVNSRLPKVPLKKKNGAPVLDEDGNPKHSKPSVWLDKHRPVEQMTWAPGEPLTIDGRLIAEGGWFERPGATTFNLYRPPIVRQGNSANADRWVELVQRVYPDDADHIITYCAHRIQHPAVKINHGIILGGITGIGKDTMLEPLRHGVGPWNFKEVSPQDIMSNYNDYMRCVVLRISEAHDLGDINRYAFYDHMKTILATPPDVIRVNGKYIPQHYVVNVAGVIYTTNHRFDGVYLPPDDRRTYVAWSEIRRQTSSRGSGRASGAGTGPAGWRTWSRTWRNTTSRSSTRRRRRGRPRRSGRSSASERRRRNPNSPTSSTPWAAKEKAQDADGKPCGPVVTTLARVMGQGPGRPVRMAERPQEPPRDTPQVRGCGYAAVRNATPRTGCGLSEAGGRRSTGGWTSRRASRSRRPSGWP